MKWFNADVGPLQTALQQTPEVLHAVSVYIAFHVPFGMVHELVNIIFLKAGVGRQFVGEYLRPRFNIGANLVLQRTADPLPAPCLLRPCQ
jgi:hypothetical protein